MCVCETQSHRQTDALEFKSGNTPKTESGTIRFGGITRCVCVTLRVTDRQIPLNLNPVIPPKLRVVPSVLGVLPDVCV